MANTYAKWQQPGSWATPEELQAFRDNSVKNGYPMSNTNLIYFLGVCPADSLMHQTFFETERAEPLRYFAGALWVAGEILVQQPTINSPQNMATPEQLTPTHSANILGFQRMRGDEYTGEWLWLPGITVFSALFQIWNSIKWLTPLAVIWALLRRDWFYGTVALLLVFGAIVTAAVDAPDARIYAWMYPLFTILIGGMVAAVERRWAARRAARLRDSAA